MKVINLYGGPGTGKSTTAAGLFHAMKLHGINCELVGEYAKDMVWREMSNSEFNDQLYITAKQNKRINTLEGKVDYVITDSPLLLGLIYEPEGYLESYRPMVEELYDRYNNFNIFLGRVKAYQEVGRNQSEEEALKIDYRIRELLGSRVDLEVTADEQAVKEILLNIP